jgi:hypothetical protein
MVRAHAELGKPPFLKWLSVTEESSRYEETD